MFIWFKRVIIFWILLASILFLLVPQPRQFAIVSMAQRATHLDTIAMNATEQPSLALVLSYIPETNIAKWTHVYFNGQRMQAMSVPSPLQLANAEKMDVSGVKHLVVLHMPLPGFQSYLW